ncbi:MAG: serine/threonine-protein kinase [Planctomycetota bacterium]|nr:serine/threonine-protein kinase [Planctomycetota bacterium]
MSDSPFPQSIDSLPLELQERLAALLEQYTESVERGNPRSLESLIQDHPHLQVYLERMIVDINALCAIPNAHKFSSISGFPHSSVSQGTVLGDFEILHEIGRGGMGIVYLAQQRSLQRRVALKILPFAAVLDPNQIARFHTEAQAAASLHHPNIVPVYSVGDERGVHYYSMQYIDGQTMEAFLQSLKQGSVLEHLWLNSTSTTARAELADSVSNSKQSTLRTSRSSNYVRQIAGKMADVARALHLAHSRGIIHRDIKPSNLMIDRGGNLWLTDFGLARIQDGQSVTIDGDLVGTLRYMSPEQANGRTHLVDHRADIYSFGASLYEMLTLRCAFDGSDRFQVLAAIQRAKPVTARSLNPTIPTDLETIIAKCMSPEKDDRYRTAGELAEDLHRFLNHQPIAARRPSVVDRLSKYALRKKKWVAAAGFAMLLLAIGSFSFAYLVTQQRKRAEMFATNAHIIVDRFGSDFADQLEGIPGTEDIRRNILRETSQYYTELLRYSEQDSTLARQAAQAAHRLGSISQRLGDLQAAGVAYRDALRRWDRLIDLNQKTAEDTIAIAACHRDLAMLQSRLGDLESASSYFDSALAILDETFATKGSDSRHAEEIAKTRSEVSLHWVKSGKLEQACELLTQSVDDLRLLLNSVPQHDRRQILSQIAFALNNHASFVLDRDPGRAADLLRQAVQLQIDSDMGNHPRLSHRMLVAIVQSNLGIAERKLGNRSIAEEKFQRAFEELNSVLLRYPDYVKAHVELAACYNNWAQLHLDNREHDRAKKCFEEAKGLLLAAQIRFPAQPEIPQFLNRIQRNLGVLIELQTRRKREDEKTKSRFISDNDGLS